MLQIFFEPALDFFNRVGRFWIMDGFAQDPHHVDRHVVAIFFFKTQVSVVFVSFFLDNGKAPELPSPQDI
jgi:hypothetical protein